MGEITTGGWFTGVTVTSKVSSSHRLPGSVAVNTTVKIPLLSLLTVKVAMWLTESIATCKSVGKINRGEMPPLASLPIVIRLTGWALNTWALQRISLVSLSTSLT